MSFLQLQEKRRTIYALDNKVSVDKETLNKLIINTVKQAPSSFNSQSSRVVIAHGAQHEAVWDIAKDILKAKIPAEAFVATEAKLNGFRAGAGTVLFFEDKNVVKGMQDQFAAYADNFPIWSEQASGMAQYAVWLALAEIGIGASLQHYNPIIDERVHAHFNVPANWVLRSQMVFGNIVSPAGTKTYMDDAQRLSLLNCI